MIYLWFADHQILVNTLKVSLENVEQTLSEITAQFNECLTHKSPPMCRGGDSRCPDTGDFLLYFVNFLPSLEIALSDKLISGRAGESESWRKQNPANIFNLQLFRFDSRPAWSKEQVASCLLNLSDKGNTCKINISTENYRTCTVICLLFLFSQFMYQASLYFIL